MTKPNFIIDIHSHVFNAGYFPIEGVLYANAPNIPKWLAKKITQLVYNTVKYSNFDPESIRSSNGFFTEIASVEREAIFDNKKIDEVLSKQLSKSFENEIQEKLHASTNEELIFEIETYQSLKDLVYFLDDQDFEGEKYDKSSIISEFKIIEQESTVFSSLNSNQKISLWSKIKRFFFQAISTNKKNIQSSIKKNRKGLELNFKHKRFYFFSLYDAQSRKGNFT